MKQYADDEFTEMDFVDGDFTDEELVYFKNRLTKTRAILTNQIEDLTSNLLDLDEHRVVDPIDVANQVTERSNIVSQINMATLKARKITTILNTFDDFGMCKTCGDDIDKKRLNFEPTLDNCLMCQEKRERYEQTHAKVH